MVSYDLIAGIDLAYMKRMRPGMVLDLYIYRQQYDDEQHSIRRKKNLLAE